MRVRTMLAAMAAAVLLAPVSAYAQKAPDAASGDASAFVGRWTGSTDWDGTQYDSGGSWWQFSPDGTFVDNYSGAGVWSVRADGAMVFQYRNDDGTWGSAYTGRVVGDIFLGTMTNGEISGVFAILR